MGQDNIDVSVIVPSLNTEHLIERCLQAVYKNVDDLNIEIIVIDNASTDSSPEILRRKYSDVILISNDINRGFAFAVNQGIRIGRGLFFFILNADAIISRGTIRGLYEFMQEHPDAGACGCELFGPHGDEEPSARTFPSIWNAFCEASYLYKLFPQSLLFGRSNMGYLGRKKTTKVEFIPGTAMMIRRETIKQVGLFDENFFLYSDDADLCYRMHRAGWSCYYVPFVCAVHLGGGTTRNFRGKMAREVMKSLFYYFYKHHGKKAEIIVKALWFLGCSIRIAGWTFLIGENLYLAHNSVYKWFNRLRECFN
jgi:GT2 family glycosyltransferase